MGRELRRVPLDFDWPIGTVWAGYLSPFDFPTCDACGGEGYGREAKAIADAFYPHRIGGPNADALAWHDKIGQAEVDNLIAENRLWDYVRDWRPGEGWVDADPPRRPTADQINAAQHERGLGGHDAINRCILVRFRCERLGIPLECERCDGRGSVSTAEERAAEEAWEPTEPPEGEGYQLWETTSEGSPQTPVFATLDALCQYAADHCTTFGSNRASAEGWRQMLGDGMVAARIQAADGSQIILI